MSMQVIALTKTSQNRSWPVGGKLYFPINCTHNTKSLNGTAYFLNRQCKSAYYFWNGIGPVQSEYQDGAHFYTSTSYGNTAYSSSLSPTTLTLDDLMGQTLYNDGAGTSTSCTVGSSYENLYTINVSAGTGGSASVNYSASAMTVSGVKYYPSGTSVTITASADNGYVFDKWSDGNTSASRSVNLTSDVSLTASFKKTYKVSFNANGGQGTMSDQSFVYGEAKRLTLNAFSRSGYSFAGWATSANGPVVYADNASVSNLTDTAGGTFTLYAKWTYTNFDFTISKYDTATEAALTENIGRLSLYCVDDSQTVATENSNGVLSYGGTAGKTYRVLCTVGSTLPDKLWNATGVKVDMDYVTDYTFTATQGLSLSKRFYFTKKNLLTIAFDSNEPTCYANVTQPATPDEAIVGAEHYAEGQDIEVTAYPSDGFKLASVNLYNSSTQQPFGEISDPQNNKFTIPNLSVNVLAYLNFSKIPYSLSARADAHSEDVITGITITKDGEDVDSATYGDEVVFEAEVADGYSFEGWYENGVKVSSNASYTRTVLGSVSLVAKCKVSVTFRIAYRDNRQTQVPVAEENCAVEINGVVVENPHTFDVILGDGFDYQLSLGLICAGASEYWNFNAWFLTSDTERENPLQYLIAGHIVPEESIDITAEVTSAVINNVVTVVLKNEETEAVIDPTGIDGVMTMTPLPASSGKTSSGCTFTYEGTKSCRLAALATFAVGGETLAFSAFKDELGNVLTEDPEFEFLVNKSRTIYAYYGSQGERVTTLAYGIGDRSMGTFSIDGVSNDNDGSATVAVSKARGQSVHIVAKPKNGYRFLGWYVRLPIGGDPFRAGTEVDVVVTTQRTLYAYFAQDPNAVYEWEGAEERKMMEWKSKVYTAPKPYNPSALRVDTEGYPVGKLTVDMFSAPDNEPTASTVLTNVASQKVRRLPRLRPERYLQVTVQNDKEVDRILVGTSAGGLAV